MIVIELSVDGKGKEVLGLKTPHSLLWSISFLNQIGISDSSH